MKILKCLSLRGVSRGNLLRTAAFVLTLFFTAPAFADTISKGALDGNPVPLMSEPLEAIFQNEKSTASVYDIGFFSHSTFPDSVNFSSDNLTAKYPDENGEIKEFYVDDYYMVKGHSYRLLEIQDEAEDACSGIFDDLGSCVNAPGGYDSCWDSIVSNINRPLLKKFMDISSATRRYLSFFSPLSELVYLKDQIAKAATLSVVCDKEFQSELATMPEKEANTFKSVLETAGPFPGGFIELSLADVRFDSGENNNVNLANWQTPYSGGFPILPDNAYSATAVDFKDSRPYGIVTVSYSHKNNPLFFSDYKSGKDFKLIAYYRFNDETDLLELWTFVPSFYTNPKCSQLAMIATTTPKQLFDKGCLRETMPIAVASPNFKAQVQDELSDLVIADRGMISDSSGYLTYYFGNALDTISDTPPFAYQGFKPLLGTEPYDMTVVDKDSVLITTSAGIEKFFLKNGQPEITPAYTDKNDDFRAYQIAVVDFGTDCQGFAFTWAKNLEPYKTPTFANYFTLVKGEKKDGICQYSEIGQFEGGIKEDVNGQIVNNAQLSSIAFSGADLSRDILAGVWVGDQRIYTNKDDKEEARAYFFQIADGTISPFTTPETYPVAIGEQLAYLDSPNNSNCVQGSSKVCGVRKLRVDSHMNLGVVLGAPIVFEGPKKCKEYVTGDANLVSDAMSDKEVPSWYKDDSGKDWDTGGLNGKPDGVPDFCQCERDIDKDGFNDADPENILLSNLKCDNCPESVSTLCLTPGPTINGWPYPPAETDAGKCYNPDQKDTSGDGVGDICEGLKCKVGDEIIHMPPVNIISDKKGPKGESCYENDADCDGWSDLPYGKIPCDNCTPPNSYYPPQPGSKNKYYNPKQLKPCTPKTNLNLPSFITSAYAETPATNKTMNEAEASAGKMSINNPLSTGTRIGVEAEKRPEATPDIQINYKFQMPEQKIVTIPPTPPPSSAVEEQPTNPKSKPFLAKPGAVTVLINKTLPFVSPLPPLPPPPEIIPAVGSCTQEVGRDGHVSIGFGEAESNADKYIKGLNLEVAKIIANAYNSSKYKKEHGLANVAPEDVRADVFVGEGGYYRNVCLIAKGSDISNSLSGWGIWQTAGAPFDPKNFGKGENENMRPVFPPDESEVVFSSGKTEKVARNDLLKNSATRIIASNGGPAQNEAILTSASAANIAPSIVANSKYQFTVPDGNVFLDQSSPADATASVAADLGATKGDPLMRVNVRSIPAGSLNITKTSYSTAPPVDTETVEFSMEGFAPYDVGSWYHPDMAGPLLQERGFDPNSILACIKTAAEEVANNEADAVNMSTVLDKANADGCMSGWDTTGWLDLKYAASVGDPGTVNVYKKVVPLGAAGESMSSGGCSCKNNISGSIPAGAGTVLPFLLSLAAVMTLRVRRKH
ncbi:MAG: hypothetical protein COV46_03810 [Deltaproteobacteria bacterium CG11_big_fil_rev_8_21_14_0_20_49_13]|nr:MAG: hypothetical protein COV46_03810 [Deltaproteobacteria bacterium CG11_big_fil_rev_8_21_14_0_20_49_13]